MNERPTIVWFRRDLRVADNPALAHAAARQAPVIPVYLPDWETGHRWAPGRASRWWLGRSLESLDDTLAKLGAPLLTLPGPADEALPALARKTGAGEVVWNRLYEPYSRAIDERVGAALERDGLGWRIFNAGLLFEPDGHVARSGKPFAQFTAYWRSRHSQPDPEPPEAAPKRLPAWRGAALNGAAIPGAGGEWAPAPEAFVWRPGEAAAQKMLERFIDCCIDQYETGRDLLGAEGTSRLSPHLHFGEIGPRQVWHAASQFAEQATAPGGAEPFLRQLGWREFAHYLLYHFPWIAEEPFRPEFACFPWQDDPAGLDAWQWASTGYPLVDASARQLLAEGWVHNRARLVSASFLTKDLLIPWQEGAAWYWDRLVDADLANNTLGWQWTAGSGPDAAPYFRVFNPALQARRFDPDGVYASRWAGTGKPPDGPIVDHGEARSRALAAFRGMRASASSST